MKNPFSKDVHVDYEELKDVIKVAVKMLDSIIDVNVFPHPHYENYQKAMRTIGLGVTGLDNVFSMFGFEYGDEDSLDFTNEIMNFIARESYMASIELAKEYGSFDFLDREMYINSGFVQKHLELYDGWDEVVDGIKKYGIRNARIGSTAPVGTMSLTFGDNSSSGCEPCFMNEVERTVRMGGQSDEHKQQVIVQDYAYRLFREKYGKDKPYNHKTAMELSVKNHLDILRVVAFHTDMSVSKTINIPTEYPFEDTKDVYMNVWKSGIKGCTIFRPNPLRQGIFNVSNDETKEDNTHQELPWGTTIESSDDLLGRKKKIMTGCGSLHVQAWFDGTDGRLMEVYLSKGSDGGCLAFMNGLSRMMSGALRTGMDFEYAIDQLKSAPACPSYVSRAVSKRDTSKGKSCPDGIANALIEMQNEINYELGIDEDEKSQHHKKDLVQINVQKKESNEVSITMEECPECKEHTVSPVGGCLSCSNCGWSKCS